MESILDRAQKLFGRAFLIAAFVPSVFFVLCTAILYRGFSDLNRHVRDLAQWKQNILELTLWLLITYLLAYILYGTRALLHRVYEGDWQITLPFKILWPIQWLLNLPYRVGIRLTTHRMCRYREIAEERVRLLDWPLWVLTEDFGKTFSTKKLTPVEARRELACLIKHHDAIITELKSYKTVSNRAFWDLLARAQVLRANVKYFDKYPKFQNKVTTFIEKLKLEFHSTDFNEQMKQAVDNFQSSADRAWASAQGSFLANFPTEERWTQATQLGALSAVNDLYPLKRYGISLNNLWPRLGNTLPDDVRQRLEDANIYVDFTIIMSFLSAVLIFVTLSLATWQHDPHLFFPRNILIPVFFLGSFLAFYRLAIGATRVFGVQVQACVDLFRLKLLDALSVERPAGIAEERAIWDQLHFFIEQGDLPTGLKFKTKPEEEAKMPAWWEKLYKTLTGKPE